MITNCSKFQPKQDAIDGHTNTHKKIMQLKLSVFISIRGGKGITSNIRDLDTQNTVTAEVRKVEKRPDCNSLFLLFYFESISHIVNILVSAIENLFLSLGVYQLQLFSYCSQGKALMNGKAWQRLFRSLCLPYVVMSHFERQPFVKRFMGRLNRYHGPINSFYGLFFKSLWLHTV